MSPGRRGQHGSHSHHGAEGWDCYGPYGRLFDPAAIIVLQGEVVLIDTFTPLDEMSAGIYLTLRTKSGTVTVHLGPQWYLEHQEMALEPGMDVVVRGSSVLFEGDPVIIAAELRQDDYVLRLRNSAGFPYWIGWRKR